MQQLSGLDAAFLYAELDKSPMHIGPLTIYNPATAPGGFVRFKDILETFSRRLDRSPVFRRKLATVPLNLDQPYWVTDEQFDLEFHVRHIALPKPGDWRQLCIQVARLHSRPLDRARPLWEAYIIEGLDNVEGLPPGCFAMFLKVHHAAIDGVSGAEIMAAIHDLTPEPPAARAPSPGRPAPDAGEEAPGMLGMLWRAYLANLKAPWRLAKLATHGVPAWRKVHQGVKSKQFHTLPKKAHVRFNDAISPHRVFGAADYDLGVIRRFRDAVEGVTVNDVILTLVGGALRRYLLDKGELPEVSLVAGAPVNVREDSDVTGGNRVSMMSVSLRSDIEDVAERLAAVHAEAVSSKRYHRAVGARMMTELGESLPAELAALAVRSALAAGLLTEMEPVFNSIVTNVPGPQVPLYMGGAEVVRSYGLGPCADGLGLFHAVTSYNGQINVAFQACREQMPDPAFYEFCLAEEYRLLQAAFPPPGRRQAAGKARKGSTRQKTGSRSSGAGTAKRKTPSRKTAARKQTPRKAGSAKAAPRKTGPRKGATRKAVKPKLAGRRE